MLPQSPYVARMLAATFSSALTNNPDYIFHCPIQSAFIVFLVYGDTKSLSLGLQDSAVSRLVAVYMPLTLINIKLYDLFHGRSSNTDLSPQTPVITTKKLLFSRHVDNLPFDLTVLKT